MEACSFAIVFTGLGSYFPTEVSLSGGVPTLAYFVFSAFFVIYSLRSRILAKVKTIRFYEGYLEMSGWKFKKQFTYQDVSSLSKSVETVTFFSEEQISFRIRDELYLFRFNNHRNKNLGTDLYSWMSRRVSAEALHPHVSIFEN